MGRWVFAVPVPGGGLAFFVACRPCLELFLPPIPPPPSPAGKGVTKVISCKGLRPLHPRAETRAARAEPALALPDGGLAQRETETGGEAHVQGAEPERHGLNLRWRCPTGGLPSGAPEQGAKPTPAGACPSGRRLGQMFRCRASYRIFQSRQKRLSRFCNTQNHSHHVCCKTSPGPGTNAGSNQEYIGKVLGGLGASFKKPPTFPRFLVSPFPRFPVSPFPRFPVSLLYLFSLPMR